MGLNPGDLHNIAMCKYAHLNKVYIRTLADEKLANIGLLKPKSMLSSSSLCGFSFESVAAELTFNRHRPLVSRSVREACLKANIFISRSSCPFLITRKTSESSGIIAETDKTGYLKEQPSRKVRWLKAKAIWAFVGFLGKYMTETSKDSDVSSAEMSVMSL